MGRRPNGYDPNRYFNQRAATRQRSLMPALAPELRQHELAPHEPAQGADPGFDAVVAAPATAAAVDITAIAGNGTSYVRACDGNYYGILTCTLSETRIPGISLPRLCSLGLRESFTQIDNLPNAPSPSPLFKGLVGITELWFRFPNADERSISVEVWDADELVDYDLYMDPFTAGLLLDQPDTTPIDTQIPPVIDVLGPIPNEVFPIGAFGPMAMAIGLGDASNGPLYVNGNGNDNGYNNLYTPRDFVTDFRPEEHRDHHFLGPNGICPACLNAAFTV